MVCINFLPQRRKGRKECKCHLCVLSAFAVKYLKNESVSFGGEPIYAEMQRAQRMAGIPLRLCG